MKYQHYEILTFWNINIMKYQHYEILTFWNINIFIKLNMARNNRFVAILIFYDAERDYFSIANCMLEYNYYHKIKILW